MSGETLLDARLVVGGLWAGAQYRSPQHGEHYLTMWPSSGSPCPVLPEGYFLSLPGPLGLGAAGLAVRIQERLGGPPTFSPDQAWYRAVNAGLPTWVHPETFDNTDLLARISEYLAATDALCAAVGLELEAGEVAKWRQDSGGAWVLTTSAGAYIFSPTGRCAADHDADVEPGVPALSTTGDDPRTSLLACWREVCT